MGVSELLLRNLILKSPFFCRPQISAVVTSQVGALEPWWRQRDGAIHNRNCWFNSNLAVVRLGATGAMPAEGFLDAASSESLIRAHFVTLADRLGRGADAIRTIEGGASSSRFSVARQQQLPLAPSELPPA